MSDDLTALSADEQDKIKRALAALPPATPISVLDWPSILRVARTPELPLDAGTTVGDLLAELAVQSERRRAALIAHLGNRLAQVARNLATREPPTRGELRRIRAELAKRLPKMFPTRDWPHIMEHRSP